MVALFVVVPINFVLAKEKTLGVHNLRKEEISQSHSKGQEEAMKLLT
jgi:hypothetical protein